MARIGSRYVWLWLVFALGACGHAPEESRLNLIGGKLAERGTFPATIYLPGAYCGAGKIGERLFITAAHCLADQAELFEPQKKLQVHYGPTRQETMDLTVVKMETHPSYRSSEAPSTLVDVGLLWVAETTPSIKTASLKTSPLAVGTAVVISGYGCVWDQHVTGLSLPGTLGLRYSQQRVEQGHEHFFSTPRYSSAQSHQEGRICPGDSGTPVYLDEGQPVFQTIVGVNSFRQPPDIWSAISRVDDEATGDVLAWLQAAVADQGVSFVP